VSKWIALAAAAALVAGIGGYFAASGYFAAASLSADTHGVSAGGAPVFTDSKWPFPIDQWGPGWAYQCKAADCGTEVNLYIRPKIGFCNCQTGVADDAELERVSDVELFGSKLTALGPGEAIHVQWMKGRSRGYQAGGGSAKPVLSLAFNNSCDVIVATVVAGSEPLAHRAAVLDFLNGDVMRNWIVQVLDP
jgi:hypothetical protein